MTNVFEKKNVLQNYGWCSRNPIYGEILYIFPSSISSVFLDVIMKIIIKFLNESLLNLIQ